MATRSETELCKGCTASVHVSESELEQLEEAYTESNTGKEEASRELYRERLAACRSCDGFIYGTTCRYCGCLIPLKAKVLEATCPYPFEPKWER